MSPNILGRPLIYMGCPPRCVGNTDVEIHRLRLLCCWSLAVRKWDLIQILSVLSISCPLSAISINKSDKRPNVDCSVSQDVHGSAERLLELCIPQFLMLCISLQKATLMANSPSSCQMFCKETPRSLEQQLQEHRYYALLRSFLMSNQ